MEEPSCSRCGDHHYVCANGQHRAPCLNADQEGHVHDWVPCPDCQKCKICDTKPCAFDEGCSSVFKYCNKNPRECHGDNDPTCRAGFPLPTDLKAVREVKVVYKPEGTMHPLDVSIDLDGTLLDNADPDGRRINLPVLNLIWFLAKGCKNVSVHFLSARPLHQQQEIANRLGLGGMIDGYHVKGDGWKPDIHFDDQHAVDLGDKNVIVRMK